MESPRLIALLLLLLASTSLSPAVAEQSSGTGTEDTLRIGVTVDPTCTVKVTPGESAPDAAIKLACRNLRAGQPTPLLIQTTPREGHDVVLIRF
jgi:hypothetical protein